MLYSIQLPSPESKLHTLCSLKSGSSTGRGIRAPLGTLSSYTRGKTKKTGKHDPVCFGLCTVTNVDWHDQLQCDLDLGNSSSDLLFKITY